MKMFIIVDKNLSKSQQGVQGGHALAQFALDHPDKFREWGNRTIVYLKADIDWMHQYETSEAYSEFREPYWNNKLTAFAVYGPTAYESLENLNLM